jgi:hypothetical protein
VSYEYRVLFHGIEVDCHIWPWHHFLNGSFRVPEYALVDVTSGEVILKTHKDNRARDMVRAADEYYLRRQRLEKLSFV